MVLGPGGQPVHSTRNDRPAAVNPLLIGRIVHAHDGHVCVPLITGGVDAEKETISGLAIAAQLLILSDLQHVSRPDVPPRIAVQNPAPTWHWPGECPWKR